MQKNKQTSPKTRRIRRPNHGSIPDLNRTVADSTVNIRTGTSRQRATMLPSEFAVPQNLTRKFSTDHQGSSLSCSRASSDRENESHDIELKLLYDEYLQGLMTEMILKKKVEEEEKLFLSQVAAVSEEQDRNEDKLFKLKTRERDIMNLTKMQNDIDLQIEDVKRFTGHEDIKMLNGIMSRLHTLLQSLDVLRCNNIILPESSEDWGELKKVLKSCNDTLKSVMVLIEPTKETYESLSDDIKDFVNTYDDIKNHQKRMEKELSNLQELVLKTISLTIVSNSSEVNIE